MRKISARVTRFVAVCGVMISLVVLQALSPATAKATLPTTVPPVLQRTAKNVTADALPTAQIDGVVWSQVIIGNKVFAGGNFAPPGRPGPLPARRPCPRANLLMYSLKSGVLKSFAPELNGPVKALAASADGKRLFVVRSVHQGRHRPSGSGSPRSMSRPASCSRPRPPSMAGSSPSP